MNKLLLTYILTIGICGVAGGGTGIVLKRTIGPIDEQYPPGFNPQEFSPDVESVWKKYEALSNKTITGVSSYSNADIINICFEKYRRQEHCWSIASGLADTMVKQTVRNSQIKNGDRYFEEQISFSSMVSLAKRSIQNGKDGLIETYDGQCSGPESASYSSEPSNQFNKEDYKSLLGKTLDEMFIYIISDKTVLDSSKITKENDTTISFDLNPNLSTFYYKYQMMNISGLENLPPFDYVKLTFTMSNELDLKHMTVDEKYTATKVGMAVSVHNIIETYYHAGEEMEVPPSTESIDYSALLALEEN